MHTGMLIEHNTFLHQFTCQGTGVDLLF